MSRRERWFWYTWAVVLAAVSVASFTWTYACH